MPVARDTADTPPRPIAALSAAATNLRERSSRTACTALNRCAILVRSVILSRIRQNTSIWKCYFVTKPKRRDNGDVGENARKRDLVKVGNHHRQQRQLNAKRNQNHLGGPEEGVQYAACAHHRNARRQAQDENRGFRQQPGLDSK